MIRKKPIIIPNRINDEETGQLFDLLKDKTQGKSIAGALGVKKMSESLQAYNVFVKKCLIIAGIYALVNTGLVIYLFVR